MNSLLRDQFPLNVFGHSPLICAAITEETIDGCRSAMARAAATADIVELRLDYLRDFDFRNPDDLRPLLEARPLPVIITCRSISEGGQQDVDDSTRLRLLVEGTRRGAEFCDIEAAFYKQAATFSPDVTRLIVSYHNFKETPSDLATIYERVTALPAAVHKIVTRANQIIDTLATFRLLDRALSDGRNLIALAMEAPGLITRIIGPSRGGFLTYGSLGRGLESAPGQISCDELKNLYHLPNLSRVTKTTGIVGNPVAHSASPAIHNAVFKALGLDFVYLPLEVDDVDGFFNRFVKPSSREIDLNLRGLSVTIPHKRAVIGHLDRLDETARRIGAVNTVVINEAGLTGFNTDARGAIEPLERMGPLQGKNCAVIGAGGAARAVAYGLVEQGARVTLFVRDVEKAKPLLNEFEVTVASLQTIGSSDAEIIINTSPVGMHGHSEGKSPIAREAFRNRSIAYDLVYNPLETEFLREARAEGIETISGIEMLIAQAAAQFELWTEMKAPIDLMRTAGLARLAELT